VAKRITKGNLWGFIQSRPYASVADIRRLFVMDVDGAAMVPTSDGTYYIGLPPEVADLVRQLWQEGRIVLDVNPDVKAQVVQGLYPARISLGRRPAQGATTKPSAAPSGQAAVARPTAPDGEGEPAGARKRRRRRKRRVPGGAGAHPAHASGEEAPPPAIGAMTAAAPPAAPAHTLTAVPAG
jgi:hypothetical protein